MIALGQEITAQHVQFLNQVFTGSKFGPWNIAILKTNLEDVLGLVYGVYGSHSHIFLIV